MPEAGAGVGGYYRGAILYRWNMAPVLRKGMPVPMPQRCANRLDEKVEKDVGPKNILNPGLVFDPGS
ncbi:MAG: hypothetical protein COA85_03075 [Robiginitomaculum sp.]|nr:MAG: hypothetical protein COA85_03075 [Robiginitomaculum sp.]